MGLRPEDARRLGIHIDPTLPPHVAALLKPTQRTEVQEKHAEAGRRARAQGAAPEEALKALHERYRAEGLGLVRRLETPIRRVSASGAGTFEAVYLAKSGVDFAGWVRQDGRAVPLDLEVKTTEAARIDISEVSPEQAAQLAETDAAGGLALVLARVADAWWLVPWAGWRSPDGKRKSLAAEHLRAVGRPVALVPVQAGRDWTFAPDWLTALCGGDSAPGRP